MKEFIVAGYLLAGIAESISEGELIRCKDCKHGFRLDDTNYIVCGRPFASNRETHTEEWFCADGKRAVK
jgi:hypothetical protein